MKKCILTSFFIFSVLFNISVFAAWEWLTYNATDMVKSPFFTVIVPSVSGYVAGGLERVVDIYGPAIRGYFEDARKYYSDVFAIPRGSKNGVKLTLETDKSALRNQIKNNNTRYPKISESLGASSGSNTGMSAGSWGYGDDYDDSKLPQAGDILTDPNTGKTYRVDSVSGCGSPTACYSGQRGDYQYQSGYFRVFGCGTNQNCPNSGATRIYVTPLSQPVFNWDNVTDEQWSNALQSAPEETLQAQRDLFNSLHGGSANSLPSQSSPAHISNTASNGGGAPDLQRIVDAVDATTSNAEPQPAATSSTTTTITRGDPVVETAADGTRTVTIPTTKTVTDADGNVISQTTETTVQTYPPGVALPDDLGVTESTETTEEETRETPDAMSAPELASIDFSPLLRAGDVLINKFPISMITILTEIIADLSTSPEIPEYVIDVGELGGPMVVTFSALDAFASWFRGVLGAVSLIFATFEAIRIWV